MRNKVFEIESHRQYEGFYEIGYYEWNTNQIGACIDENILSETSTYEEQVEYLEDIINHGFFLINKEQLICMLHSMDNIFETKIIIKINCEADKYMFISFLQSKIIEILYKMKE